VAEALHGGQILFDQAAAEDIGPTGIESGKRLADLEDMFLVGDETEGRAENRFQGGMDAGNGGEALIAAGELILFQFVGGAGTDDRNNRNKAVDIPRPAHPVQRGHGRALHMVNSAGPAGADHVPDFLILPWGETLEIEGGGWLRRRG